jgi:putative transposase
MTDVPRALPAALGRYQIYGHFRPRRHLMAADDYRPARTKAFRIWRQKTCVHHSA